MNPDSLQSVSPNLTDIDYLKELLNAGIIFAAIMVVGFFAKLVVFKWVTHLTAKSKTQLDDIIIRALRSPLLIWFAILGMNLSTRSITLPYLARLWIDRFSVCLVILSIAWLISRIITDLIGEYAQEMEGGLAVTSLTRNFVKIIVFTVGGLFALQALGIPTAPIITALGVGGLAVALALQDTLNNLFSGIYIMISKQVRVGDYVHLDSGQEGVVNDVAWRITTIRSSTNNNILIPNSKLAQAIVTNFNLPEKRLSLPIVVRVSYHSDPDQVEKILIDEAVKANAEFDMMLDDPPPVVRLNPGFGDSSLDFTLWVQVREFADQFVLQSELRKRILKRFKVEGIEIPFPQRMVHLSSVAPTNQPPEN